MKITKHTACEPCAEIVAQGYTDLDLNQELQCKNKLSIHQNLCNKIDTSLEPKEYFLSEFERIDPDDNSQLHHAFNTPCEYCGTFGTHIVKSANPKRSN